MKTALFPGSFDPPSLGHLDIIERAAVICDKLYVGVAQQNDKRSHFSTEEKVAMLKTITQHLSQVEVVSFTSLVVEFAKHLNVTTLLRGLRAFSDFEYEFRMALANRKMSGIETLFLMADPKLSHISSSLIREIARHDAHLQDFIPKPIEPQIFERLSAK